MTYDFFSKVYFLIYFVYGLSFFLMGFAIAMNIRTFRSLSNLALAKPLWLLAAFGITHGLSEWAEIFIPIQSQYISRQAIDTMLIAKDLVVATSFLFLFYFGSCLTVDSLNKYKSLRHIPLAVYGFWLLNFIFFPVFINSDLVWWMLAGETWTRYLLALPGAIFSSYALWLQNKSFNSSSHPAVAKNFRYAAVVFAVYAIVAGWVVPKAEFFPASVINVESFFNTFHIPIQVLRAACGIAMAYYVIRTLEVFDLENKKNLEEAFRMNLLFQERNRIGRDLHDGIIQQIFVVGLQLENAYYLIKEDVQAAQVWVKNGMEGLDNVVKDIRNYIMNLQPTNFEEPNLQKGLSRIIDNFRANSLVYVDFIFHGESKGITNEQTKNIYHIAQETLNNILKHSGATLVEIELAFLPEQVELRLRDNGKGFDTQILEKSGDYRHHRGLRNIQERCRLIGANLELKSSKGKGTEVNLIIRTGGEVNGKDSDFNCG